MYKVFVNDKPLNLIPEALKHEVGQENPQLEYAGPDTFVNALELLSTESEVTVYHAELKPMWKSFKKRYQYIKAAGGVVSNPNGQLLFILRFGIWDLPKGKIEKGEKPKTAAVREVEEECGVRGLTITGKLPSTYHIYQFKGRSVLKRTHWFRMVTDYDGPFKPQLEEDITEVKWLNDQEATLAIGDSYASIRELMRSY